MAAHADLVLAAIEPFRLPLVPNYSSVGYRSRDTSFHTDGALVHIFKQVDPLYPNAPTCLPSDILQSLRPQTLETKFGNISSPGVYVTKYSHDPAHVEGSPIHYLQQTLKSFVEDQLKNSDLSTSTLNTCIQHISDTEVPLFVEVSNGAYLGKSNGQIVRYELRNSLLDVIDQVLPFWVNSNQETIIFSGLVFNQLGSDFSSPPLSNHVLILGNNQVHGLGSFYVQHMLTLAKDALFESFLKKADVEPRDIRTETCKNTSLVTSSSLCIELVTKRAELDNQESAIVGEEFSLVVNQNNEILNIPGSIVYLDKLALVLFKLNNWRELWAKGVHLATNEQLDLPLVKSPSLCPRSYKFDICFGSKVAFDSQAFYNILWQVAGDIITKIELLNVYESPDGCNSSCYRIVYQSFDKALYREKVIAIHQNIIGRTVCEKLGVSTN